MDLLYHKHAPEVPRRPRWSRHSTSLKTIFDHKERISRTLKYIEAHLEDPLNLKHLARVACLSDFHFHRSFSYYMGDTVSGYVRKRRLAKAAEALRDAGVKVTDVALAAGYETVEAFSKAFKRAYGVSPSAFQRHAKDIGKTPPRRVNAMLLKPFWEDDIPRFSGREAFMALWELIHSNELQEKDATWISVFPDFQPLNITEKRNPSPLCITLGRLRYELIFLTLHAEFQIVNSGSCAVLHYDNESIAFRKSASIIPPARDQVPRHLAFLPIGYRSILCVAD